MMSVPNPAAARDEAVAVHAASGPPGADLATWLADELSALGWTADGLYVATSNAGRHESVAFWRSALETGLAFANPRLFPWTLSNSPTGSIARALGVRGPTYTLVGALDAVEGAFEHAAADLADGLVARALIVATAVDSGGCPAVAAALVTDPLTIGYRELQVSTFVECLTSSSSRPMATSQRSR